MDYNINEIVKTAYKALDSKKAEDIKILDIKNVTVMADYFIIAHGNNKNHIQTLAKTLEEELDKIKVFPKQKEGYMSASWILMDYGNIIIHLFGEEDRLFYDLERIWSDGKEVAISSI